MAPSLSGGGSGSGAPTIRSSVTPTTGGSWSRRPDTKARYTTSCAGRPQPLLDPPDEPRVRQVVTGDRGLEVGGANHSGPFPPVHVEARGPDSRDEGIHERVHAFLLRDPTWCRCKSDPLGDESQRSDHR